MNRLRTAFLAGALVALAACPASTPTSTPTLVLSPASVVLLAGSPAFTIDAALSNSEGSITWSLSPAVGSLSAETGASVTYTPPASVDAITTVVITAKAGDLQAQAKVVVNPLTAQTGLTVAPALAMVLAAGEPLVLTAAPVASGQSVTWTMDPQVGTLTPGAGNAATATFTPPATLEAKTTVSVTATSGTQVAHATIIVTPVPGGTSARLTVSPATAEVQAGTGTLAVTATLTDSDATISWALFPPMGTLSAETGAAVDYTPPSTIDEPTLVEVRATAGEAKAAAVILVLPAPAIPSLSVSPKTLTLEAGSDTAVLVATLLHSTDPITWTLDSAVGTLTATTGAAVGYKPPASIAAETQVVAKAKAGSLTAEVTLTVQPVTHTLPTLAVTPAIAGTLSGGIPVVLTADVTNSASTVLWSLSPTVGTLSAVSGPTVTYTPPATLDVDTPVTVFAMLDDLRKQAVITVSPAPKLSVDPASATVTTAIREVPLTATLLHSSETITWSLSPEVGSLTATFGAATTYVPPTTIGVPTTVVVTASAAGITASASVVVQPAPGPDSPPLLNQRFVPFTKIVEYMVLGTSPDGTANNEFVVNPYAVFGKIDDQPISLPPGTHLPTTAIPQKALNNDLLADMTKVARAGNVDSDFPEETVVLSWKPQQVGKAAPAGCQPVAKLTILDASLATPTSDPTITPVVPVGVDLTVEAGQKATDYDLALGDVDGDGYDEIVVVGTVNWDEANSSARHAGKLWVFDDLAHGCKVDACPPLGVVDLPGDLDTSLVPRGVQSARVAVGSMTEDRKAQIVVAWVDQVALLQAWTSNAGGGNRNGVGTLSYAIFDGATRSQIGANRKTGSVQTILNDAFVSPNLFNIALADVDHDYRKELIVTAWNSMQQVIPLDFTYVSSTPRLEILDDLTMADAAGKLVSLVLTERPWETTGTTGKLVHYGALIAHYPRTFLVPVDFNADLTEELLIAGYPCHFKAAVPANGTTPGTPAAMVWDDNVKPIGKAEYHAIADMQVGDVNGDRRQDFLVLDRNGRVRAWGLRDKLQSVGGYPLEKTYQPTPEFLLFDTSGTTGTVVNENALLVPANVDGDSTLLEYAGYGPTIRSSSLGSDKDPHVLLYGNNKIVAVLAAPPVYGNLGQALGNNVTTFGSIQNSSYSSTLEVQTRAGVIVGADVEFPFGIVKAEVEAEFMLEYTHNNTWTRSETHSLTFGATDAQNQVVFATTPYDRYLYAVTSSSTPQAVGSIVVVDVPQPSTTLSVTLDKYNEWYSDGIQITSDTLANVPYDLSTYPRWSSAPGDRWVDVGNQARMLAIHDSFGSTGPFAISQGAVPVTAEVTIEEGSGYANGVSFSVDVEASVTYASVKKGFHVGFSVGGSWEQSTSDALAFGATVYGIPKFSDWEANKYKWGLVAYKQRLCTQACDWEKSKNVVQDFMVVNYWLEDM